MPGTFVHSPQIRITQISYLYFLSHRCHRASGYLDNFATMAKILIVQNHALVESLWKSLGISSGELQSLVEQREVIHSQSTHYPQIRHRETCTYSEY